MAMLRFFRLPKHQQYEYKPRYWDPKKEELQERLQQIEDMKASGPEGAKARIASGLRRGYNADAKFKSRQVRKSNFTLLAIILFLLLLSYVILSVYSPQIVEVLS